jgi:Ala-tRNA(Pro) deacylase
MDCKSKLEKYLRENGVEFKAVTHPTAYTAQEIAAAERVPGRQFAKVAMVMADGKMMMLVLPASHRVDFPKLRAVLQVKDAHLAKEGEFANIFPDCDTGAMPPFGNLYDVPVYADTSLTADPEIVFNAGTHRETLRIKYADYARLAQPTVAEFAVHL